MIYWRTRPQSCLAPFAQKLRWRLKSRVSGRHYSEDPIDLGTRESVINQ